MTFIEKTSLALLITASLFALALLIGTSFIQPAKASSGFLPATIATTSLVRLISGAATSIIATSSCTARIISTASTSIMLTFSDYANQTPTAIFGNWQAASTTVAYDSSLYGCGLVKAFDIGASGVITVTDVR